MMYFSVSDTGILGKRKSEFSQLESNLRHFDYYTGCSTTELHAGDSWELRPLN